MFHLPPPTQHNSLENNKVIIILTRIIVRPSVTLAGKFSTAEIAAVQVTAGKIPAEKVSAEQILASCISTSHIANRPFSTIRILTHISPISYGAAHGKNN